MLKQRNVLLRNLQEIIYETEDKMINELLNKNAKNTEFRDTNSSMESNLMNSAVKMKKIKKIRNHQPISSKKTPAKYDRHNIPIEMIERVKNNKKNDKLQKNLLHRVRLSHMGYVLPPDENDSSDDESVQNVKRLVLLRTPYFLLPTVKISKIRKKERHRNAFLKDDRLNRINLLLFERENITPKPKNVDSENGDKEIKQSEPVNQPICNKFFKIAAKKNVKNPEKEKYYKLISDKFNEHRPKCEPDDRVTTF